MRTLFTKMAENYSKPMFGWKRKKCLIKFNSINNSFDKYFKENDLNLEKVLKSYENGRQRLRRLLHDTRHHHCTLTAHDDTDDDTDTDDDDFDFEGFSADADTDDVIKRQLNHYAHFMARSVDTNDVQNDEITDKIQKLLKSQWEDRIRRLNVTTTEDDNDDNPHVLVGAANRRLTTTTDDNDNSNGRKSKNILRKARLHINKKTLLKIRKDQSLLAPPPPPPPHLTSITTASPHNNNNNNNKTTTPPSLHTNRSGQPGFITCAICNATKYYSHVQRRYGVFSCEPCSKFFARFIKEPKQYFCSNKGDCPMVAIAVTSRQQCNNNNNKLRPTATTSTANTGVSSLRCKACWLKVCLQKFSIDDHVRHTIAANFSPKLVAPPNVSLITLDCTSGGGVSSSSSQHNTSSMSMSIVHSNHGNGSGGGGTLLRSRSHLGHNDVTHGSSRANNQHSLLMVAAADTHTSGPRVKRVCRSAGVVSGLPRATFATGCYDSDSDELPVDVYLCRAYEQKSGDAVTTTHAQRANRRCGTCSACRAQDCGLCHYCVDKKKTQRTGSDYVQCSDRRKCVNAV